MGAASTQAPHEQSGGEVGSLDRSIRARRGPLAGIRVADFCWMGVGSVATRLLADFGAEVIKIEDRIRIDTPRRLPIYKDEPARNFGEEVIDADPNKGGLFNNYCRNKLGVTINMRTREGPRAGRAADRREQRRLGELRARRDGAVGPHLRAAPRAVARRHLRPHERLRPHRPARRVPQLRPGRAGRQRSVLHQRAARPGAVGLGPVVHGQPGRLLQLGGAADGASTAATSPARAPRSTCRPIEAGINLVGPVLLDVTRQRAHDRAARTTRPATGSSGPTPRRTASTRRAATTGGSPSPCSTTTSGPASSSALGRPDVGRRRALRHARTTASPTRTCSTSTSPRGRADRDRHEIDRAAAGRTACRPARCRTPRTSTRRDPQIAAPRRVLRDGPSGDRPGPVRGQPVPVLARPRPDNWRSAPLLGEDNAYVFKDIVGIDDDEYDRADGGGGDLMPGDGASSTACGSSSSPATRPARCSASCSPRWAPTSSRSSRRRDRRPGAIGPFADDRADADHSLTFWYYNTNKRSVVLDDRDADGRAELLAPARRRRRLHHDAARRPRLARSRPRGRRRSPSASDRAGRRVDHAVRPRRPVGRPAQLRPRRPRPRQPAQQLRLRRPLDPADPPGRRPGLPVGGELRPDGARCSRCIERQRDRPRPGRRRRHARLPGGERRAGQPVLVLPAGRRAPADVPPRPADADRSRRCSRAATAATCTS